MSKPTAIIIGAGIGGLATAIQLARAGVEVTIYEKNSSPGGRCQRLNREGHIFDTGPTMYLFPQIFQNFFQSIDEDINEHLKLLQCEPTYLLNFADNFNFTLTNNLDMIQNQLETIEPGSFQKFKEYLLQTKNHYEFALNRITQKDLRQPLDYFNVSNLYCALKFKALHNHYAFLSKFFTDPHLKAVFTFQDSYLGLDPFHTPSLFSLLSYVEFTQGNFLPKGGMYKIIEALEKIALKHKVKIIYNQPVKKVETNDNKATSVILNDNSQKIAEYIIVNADLSYAYHNLLPNDPYKEKLRNKKYSCSVFVFHWGLDKIYPQLNTHNIFFAKDYKNSFNTVVNTPTPPFEPHFYIQAPARTDPTRAPLGHDTLSVMVPINHIYQSAPVDWEKYKIHLKEYIFNRLFQAGIKDIKDHIKFEITYAPQDWQSYLNLTNGSVYGLHHNLTQIGYLRPSRTHTKYKNVFFVGSSTHPGSGLPTVLLSSQFTTQRILETLGETASFLIQKIH